MLIQNSRPCCTPTYTHYQPSPNRPPQDSYQETPKQPLVKRVAKFTLPTALGVYAALRSGVGAGLAGALAVTPAVAVAGALGGAYVGDKLDPGFNGIAGGLALGVMAGVGAGLVTGGLAGYGNNPILSAGVVGLGALSGYLLASNESI